MRQEEAGQTERYKGLYAKQSEDQRILNTLISDIAIAPMCNKDRRKGGGKRK